MLVAVVQLLSGAEVGVVLVLQAVMLLVELVVLVVMAQHHQ
jgi:hypothetical protein